jgi:uncharacterized protein YacL
MKKILNFGMLGFVLALIAMRWIQEGAVAGIAFAITIVLITIVVILLFAFAEWYDEHKKDTWHLTRKGRAAVRKSCAFRDAKPPESE